jgi:hypothetical protein
MEHEEIKNMLQHIITKIENIEMRIAKIESHFFETCDLCNQQESTVMSRACCGGENGWYCRQKLKICDECDKSYNLSGNCGHRLTFC